jgi:hypothetical protein
MHNRPYYMKGKYWRTGRCNSLRLKYIKGLNHERRLGCDQSVYGSRCGGCLGNEGIGRRHYGGGGDGDDGGGKPGGAAPTGVGRH